ncbi:hypothetical protein DRQ16_04795 [bacterium]|nr:MAG: hypothetical protein DRQ16_04795 [bacterium]
MRKTRVKTRNLLCIKKKENLDLGHLLLYEPYKNIIANFIDLATHKEAKDFDPVAKVYDGLLSAPPEIRDYYEALLGVTSYYQHSQGGRGRYIEKKLASSFETCSLDIKLSEIPFWLTHPDLHKKRGIFTQRGLSSEEKSIFRTFAWDWIGDRDEETDLGSIIRNEQTVVLVEIKNRVDSGGTAARREIWTSQKFGILLDYLITERKIYRCHDKEKKVKEFSLSQMFKYFGIKCLEMYIGILFDKSDAPATMEADRARGFLPASREGYEYLMERVKKSGKFQVLEDNIEMLKMEIKHIPSGLLIRCGALYGDEITERLFRRKMPVSDLLLLKYDDIWLSQLIAISERTFLLKHGKNYMILFIEILKEDFHVREIYNKFIESEGKERYLKKLVEYVLKNHRERFPEYLCPPEKGVEEYLGDVIQVLGASEA